RINRCRCSAEYALAQSGPRNTIPTCNVGGIDAGNNKITPDVEIGPADCERKDVAPRWYGAADCPPPGVEVAVLRDFARGDSSRSGELTTNDESSIPNSHRIDVAIEASTQRQPEAESVPICDTITGSSKRAPRVNKQAIPRHRVGIAVNSAAEGLPPGSAPPRYI